MSDENKTLQLFELSENPVIKDRQLMLKVPEVLVKLSPIESIVTEATTKPIIKELPPKYIVDQIAILVPMICKDLGITKWNDSKEKQQYTLTRFYQAVTRYYTSLSVNSIKLAFDMLAVGQLDDYLPKDRNQQPDKNHYGEFSFEFYTRILNAYVKKSADVWGKVRLCLPKKEEVISEQQRKENKNNLVNDLYEAFYNYKINKIEPSFDLAVHFNELISLGLLEKKKYSSKSVDAAYKRLLVDSHISKSERRKMKEEYAFKRKTHKLEIEAQRIENNKTMAAYFEKLITEGKDIREFLKLIE